MAVVVAATGEPQAIEAFRAVGRTTNWRASLLLWSCAAWVGFATILDAAIRWLNR